MDFTVSIMTGKSIEINNTVDLMNVVQLTMTKADQDATDQKILLVRETTNGPRVIAVNSELLTSEYRDDSSSSCETHERTLSKESHLSLNEPPVKRLRIEDCETQTCKESLISFCKNILTRLKLVEKKMDQVTRHYHNLEEKVEHVSNCLQEAGCDMSRSKSGAVIVGLPQDSDDGSSKVPVSHLGPNVTLITLNSEEDYPEGSWLGDENDPEMMVRCHISPSDLANVNRTCPTPEKMALTLLDYIFDRETQAQSNISGLGRHGKKQLDPLMIYGIRCHLIQKFQINETDWHRIKQNMDSKCRTAFRRKQKGMSLTVKAFKDRWLSQDSAMSRMPAAYIQMITSGSDEPVNELVDAELAADHDLDLNAAATINIPISVNPGQPTVSITMEEMGEIIHMPPGDLQVVHATPEQLAQIHQFQQSGQIQILAHDLIHTSDDLPDST